MKNNPFELKNEEIMQRRMKNPFNKSNVFTEDARVKKYICSLATTCKNNAEFKKLKKEYKNKCDIEGYIYSQLIFIDNLQDLERITCSTDMESIKELPNIVVVENSKGFVGAIYKASREEIIFEKIIKKHKDNLLKILCEANNAYYYELEKNFTYTISDYAGECDYYLSYSDIVENGAFNKYKDILYRLAADIEADEMTLLVKKDITKQLNITTDFKNTNEFFNYIEEKHIKQIPNAYLLFMPSKIKKDICLNNIISEIHFDNLLNHFNQSNPNGMREILKRQLKLTNVTKKTKKAFKEILDSDYVDFYINDDKQEQIKNILNNLK